MADSDYEYEDDNASDDEYMGSKSSPGVRQQAAGKRKAQEKAPERKAQAWARRGSTPPEDFEYTPAEEDADDETIPEKTLQQIEEERKRKRYVVTPLVAR